MRNNKHRTTQGTKAKRGFAVLDRDDAVKVAAGALELLRRLFRFAASASAWRCGLDHALAMVETELSDILLFSSAKLIQDDLFCDSEAELAPSDLGKARKDAAGAVKVLRKLLKDARADLSVDESPCNQLDNALDRLEEELNALLPPPGSPPKAKLPDVFSDDEGEPELIGILNQ